jgi:coatomer protein complex subunit epsilon
VAEKELKNMYKLDEDATLTQLTTAWVNMKVGGEKLQEAYYILQELAEKFSHTVQILNGLAVYHMLAGKYEEAERLLKDSLDKSGGSDADTFANLIACAPRTGKSADMMKRYESQLASVAPHHGFVTDMTAMGAAFDRACEQMA